MIHAFKNALPQTRPFFVKAMFHANTMQSHMDRYQHCANICKTDNYNQPSLPTEQDKQF